MNKKDEEIQRKLKELENMVLKETEEQQAQVPSSINNAPSDVLKVKSSEPAVNVKNDLYYFGGIGLILLGLVLLFNHVRISTGFMTMMGLGGGGIGLVLVVLLVGFGWLVYDSKSKVAWLLTGGTCAVICLMILSSLVMSFPTMSLLGTIGLLAPFALGGAFLLKGVGGPKAIENKLKKRDDSN